MKQPNVSIENVARIPLPGTAIPTSLQFSPDDWMVTYLYSDPSSSKESQLFAYLPTTGEHHLLVKPGTGQGTDENISPEEALRRERLRMWTQGITQYSWAKNELRLIIPLQGNLYGVDSPDKPMRCIYESIAGPVQDSAFSHDGTRIAFVQSNELYVIPFTGGQAQQLTYGAQETGKVHGLAEYVAQEEMGRMQGFWWSPDDAWLAYTEVDETHIPLYRIIHQGKPATGESAQEDHRYPFAGQPNAIVRLGIVPVSGGDTTWLDLGPDPDIYIARVNWLPNGHLAVQVENRAQTRLDIYTFDPHNGSRSLLMTETNAIWINLHNMFYPLKDFGVSGKPGFVWASERSGFRHLYLYDGTGQLIRQLTIGSWQVDSLSSVDEDHQVIYFTASRQSPLESHLYSVNFEAGQIKQITQTPGMHSIVIDHANRRFIDTVSNINLPPLITLRQLEDNEQLSVIFDRQDPRIAELNLTSPELVSFTNSTGHTLYGAIYHPPDQRKGSFPAIVSVYGGPHAQMVTNSWSMTVAMRAQYLSSLGYLVFVLDNRGSARRGIEFESSIKFKTGHAEVDDQVDGVNWLVQKGLADPDRVAIYGWSYGGYMSAISLARAPQIFKCAVVGAPVTFWEGYDTHYTERYMGTPQNNPAGYKESSVLEHVEGITGKLLLIHGLIDENVHFRHTARLINALIHARKPYELLIFPDERHMSRKLPDRIYMEERIRDFFTNNL